MEKKLFEHSGKKAALYRSALADRPLILLSSYEEAGEAVIEALRSLGAPECNLLVIGGLDWNHDLSPWNCPQIYKDDAPFTGGADDYLKLLLERILPDAMSIVSGTPSFTAITGYSLAGLFALHAMYKCDAFSRAASVSGSLWFPDFREFALTHEMPKRPSKLYLSLGDKEAKTRNPYMKTVQENTELLAKHYKEIGIDVTFELNPGNHFRDADLRTAKGIKAILE